MHMHVGHFAGPLSRVMWVYPHQTSQWHVWSSEPTVEYASTVILVPYVSITPGAILCRLTEHIST